MLERWKWHFRASRFQTFLGEHAPRPPSNQGASILTAAYFSRVGRLLQNILKPLLMAVVQAHRMHIGDVHCKSYYLYGTIHEGSLYKAKRMKAVQFVLSYPMCFFGSLVCFIVAFVHFSAKNVGGAVAPWLVHLALEQVVQVLAMARGIVVFLGMLAQDTLLLQCFSPQKCVNWYWQMGNSAMD